MELVLTVALGAWVAWQIWNGYRDGLWVSLIGLLALVMAYLCSILFGARAAAWLNSTGIAHVYAMLIAYSTIFLVAVSVFKWLPLLLFRRLKHTSAGLKALGAGLGGIKGLVTGLVALWFLKLAGAALGVQQQEPADAETAGVQVEQVDEEPAVMEIASDFVARGTELGTTLFGMEQTEVVTLSAMVRQPEVVMGGMRSLMQAEAMQSLLHRQDTQQMMALNDVGSLQSSATFQALMAEPDIIKMQQTLELQGKSEQASERFIAEQITSIWRRFEYLKTDSRVQALLKDPELQSALQDNKPVALLANPKFQQLTTLILDGKGDIDEAQLNTLLSSAVESRSTASDTNVEGQGVDLYESGDSRASIDSQAPKPYEPQTVYMWRDANGAVQYSDWEHIPPQSRDKAKPLRR